jgi:hypothetical protein
MQAAEPPSILFQLAITIAVLVVIYVVMLLVDKSITAYSATSNITAVLIQDTTGDTTIIPQSLQSGAPLIYPSSNQGTGIEFSYSFFLNLSADTFSTSTAATCSAGSSSTAPTVLKHIFTKGTANSFPLMAPGLFCRGDKNTLRVYMNTVDSWDNYVEVDNIPIGKWFHTVILLTGSYMDIYINGNIAQRIKFRTVPKINFGPVFVFNNRRFPDATSVAQKDFIVDGSATGMISRLKYYAYALNASQIDSLYRNGPSSRISGNTVAPLVPYMTDTWWTGQTPGK